MQQKQLTDLDTPSSEVEHLACFFHLDLKKIENVEYQNKETVS